MYTLENRTAVVTGGAQGMGATTARRLHEAGAHVVVTDVREEDGRALAAELGERARFQRLDVADPADWAALTDSLEGLPPFRVLVNNAGIHWKRSIRSETPADFELMMRVNVLGPMLGTQAAIDPMTAAGGGSIINLCSILSLMGSRASGAYVASKWALRGLTKTAALELGPRGIRVNAILPGFIETPMQRQAAGTGRSEDYYQFLALGRRGTTDEIADVALYLASDASSYVTGTDISVDGGLAAGTGPASGE